MWTCTEEEEEERNSAVVVVVKTGDVFTKTLCSYCHYCHPFANGWPLSVCLVVLLSLTRGGSKEQAKKVKVEKRKRRRMPQCQTGGSWRTQNTAFHSVSQSVLTNYHYRSHFLLLSDRSSSTSTAEQSSLPAENFSISIQKRTRISGRNMKMKMSMSSVSLCVITHANVGTWELVHFREHE